MHDYNQSLSKIEKAIKDDCEKKKKEIEKELSEYRDLAISEADSCSLAEAYNIIQGKISEIRRIIKRDLSKAKLESKQELLHLREELTDSVFASIIKRLVQFVDSDDYELFLKNQAAKILADYPDPGSTIFLSEKDMRFAPAIKNISGDNFNILSDTKIIYGGIKLLNHEKGFIVDLTIDTMLEEEREKFLITSGLTLV